MIAREAATVRVAPVRSGRTAPIAARRPVAVIVSRFPLITETFILREIEELERQGQPVLLVPLIRERGRVAHREAGRWIDRMLYVPFVSRGVIAANLRVLWRQPRRYIGALVEAVSGAAHSFNVLVRTLALFPKTVCLAVRLPEHGVRHVHAHFATYPAGAALAIARLGGPSYSFTAHAHDIFVHWRHSSLRRKVSEARFVRAIAANGREHLVSCCGDEAASKIDVIHVGVRPEDYDDSSLPGRAAVPTLLCVAGLKPYKGLAVLLEACQRLKETGRRFHCEIVGDGPLRPEIERLRASMNLQDFVTLRGALRQDEVTAMLAASDIAVAPSIVATDGQMDGIPVSLMEAMAAGRPVVASRLSGVPELVDDGVTGILTEPGNAAELATAIQRLLDDPHLAARMGRRGRRKVSRDFRLERSVRALLERIDSHNPGLAPEEHAPWLDAIDALVPERAIGIRRVRERPDSTVVDLLASDGQSATDLVVKIHSARGEALRSKERRAEHEFCVMDRLQSMAEHEDPATPGITFSVARVLDRAGPALLLEPCSGRLLVDLARQARFGGRQRRAALVDAVRNAGHWLRVFQQNAGSGGLARATVRALAEQACCDLSACEAAGILAPRERARIEQRLEALSSLAATSVTGKRTSGHHGDFWPGNVFGADRGISVIDFEGFRYGLPYEDVAYFLVQLELFFPYFPYRRIRRELRDAFLEGYGGAERVDHSVYEFCRLVKALQILSNHARRGGLDNESGGRRSRRALRRVARRG
ncbi:MAG TPA: glycosyltransferase [Vicinamibacterales bacterium]|nr:glycosyltransferase [Vicinamibacterales bacterium]